MGCFPAIIMFTCLCTFLLSVVTGNEPSPYEALQSYDFPVGLLPQGATGYRLNRSTGEFTAYHNGTCSFTLDNSYQVNYKEEIKGVISKGRLRRLTGVSVKVLMVWLNIVEVDRKDDDLKFSVGFTSASFPVRNFDQCPRCRCGLLCGEHDHSAFSM